MCFPRRKKQKDTGPAPTPAAPQLQVTSTDGVSRVKSTGRRTAEATARLKESKFGEGPPTDSAYRRRSTEGHVTSGPGGRHSGHGGQDGGMYGHLYGPVSGNMYHHVNGGMGGAPSGGMYAAAMAGTHTANFGTGVTGMADGTGGVGN